LSSAILYLAIVGIWAVVLVPRWLRPPHTSQTLESNLAEPVDTSRHGDLAREDDEVQEQEQEPQQRAPTPAEPSAAERHARILQARKRTLMTLVVLTAGAVTIAAAHLAAPWVAIPPTVMLTGFVLLLREAARIDAGRARAAASRRGRGAGADVEASPGAQADTRPADPVQAGVPGAQVIDISARVGDQLYDQYADAEVRAVGD
jgi:hypothetical protein